MKEHQSGQNLEADHMLLIQRKKYTSPNLIRYGSVAKLSQSGNGTGADGGTMAGMHMV